MYTYPVGVISVYLSKKKVVKKNQARIPSWFYEEGIPNLGQQKDLLVEIFDFKKRLCKARILCFLCALFSWSF
jgi:hypothetical protein